MVESLVALPLCGTFSAESFSERILEIDLKICQNYGHDVLPPPLCRPKVTRTPIGSHRLQVDWCHQRAALMTGSAGDRVFVLFDSSTRRRGYYRHLGLVAVLRRTLSRGFVLARLLTRSLFTISFQA